jgi:hypothetical protein
MPLEAPFLMYLFLLYYNRIILITASIFFERGRIGPTAVPIEEFAVHSREQKSISSQPFFQQRP